jgi:hypothetical protein
MRAKAQTVEQEFIPIDARGVTDALGGRWSRAIGKATCPICDSENLVIFDRRRKVVIACIGGCDLERVVMSARRILEAQGIAPDREPRLN